MHRRCTLDHACSRKKKKTKQKQKQTKSDKTPHHDYGVCQVNITQKAQMEGINHSISNVSNQFQDSRSRLYQNASSHALNRLHSAALELAQLREAIDMDLRLFIAL